MKKIILAAFAAIFALAGCSRYETVKGDPMKSKIYTLDNGLKVYMTVNKDEPRIQTYIAVRAGGKNDPADNTGLSHYLEHMMFKGTEKFGTSDYSAEKPMLAQIDSLFEVYRTLTDEGERLALYSVIDSISYEASRLAIPNEYDKLMSVIGSDGSNAYTSNDVTCYVEEIPSNRIEDWAKIEADRFRNCVFRGFHTELEAVYEEKNMSLVSDSEKAFDAVDSMLFLSHPYGTQTVIGTQDHLKNPSLKAIRKHKDTYYVPNNMAICLSGDFDPDEMVSIIEKYFGDWEPNPAVPEFVVEAEAPIEEPREKDVYGYESEFLFLGWRTPGSSSRDSEISDIVAEVLYNGMAGLLDLDVVSAQKVLDVGAFCYNRNDYGMFAVSATPKEGQTLDEVRDIVLEEMRKLREGEFDESLVEAVKSNYKLYKMQALENNSSRADMFVDAFVSGTPWKDVVTRLSRVERFTKEDVVAWADKYLGANSYAAVYKRIGEDKSIRKIDAPKITPILSNREMQSDFVAEIIASEPGEIEPVFVDYSKDMSVGEYQGQELLYKKNEKNDIAFLSLRFDRGSDDDPLLKIAASYLEYLGTPDKSADEISSILYSLACNSSINVGANVTTISVSGLSENIGEALRLTEERIFGAEADEEVLDALKGDIIRERSDAKLNQRACQSALRRYQMYGPDYIKQTTLSNKDLLSVTSADLLAVLSGLCSCGHKILYYGPEEEPAVRRMLSISHAASPDAAVLVKSHPEVELTPSPVVLLAPYKSRQFNYMQFSCRGEAYELSEVPAVTLFNEYFGGGMNAIVFQEMRESRALAYSAGARLIEPSFIGDKYRFMAFIASQNDKLEKAVRAFDEIIETMPQAPENLRIAKASILSQLRTKRTIGASVLYSYLDDKELGLDESVDRLVFEKVGDMTMDDLLAAHKRWIEGRTYSYAILGDPSDLDLKFLSTLGPVKKISLEELFGY
ncbi:MAG: insulinase family protein [Bacteroidales bacterium]|nr:insulinase family protein [Bacteroidales bacterium]